MIDEKLEEDAGYSSGSINLEEIMQLLPKNNVL